MNCAVGRENLIAFYSQPIHFDEFISGGYIRNTHTCILGTTSTLLQILVYVGNLTHFLGVPPCSPVTTPTVLYLIYRAFHDLWTLLQWWVSYVFVIKKVHINKCPILDGYGVMTA